MKHLIVIITLLLLPCTMVLAATRANVYVQAQLQGLSMSLTATDIQMAGKTGGTARNNIVEFGSITTLSNGKFATAPEILKVDFDPGNNMFNIQVYLSNSGEGYSVSKFKGHPEANYWDLGSEANGLIGTNNHDYVAAMLWSCRDDNANISCNTNGILSGSWGYFKDKYTHVGEGASGLLLATNTFTFTAGQTNSDKVRTAQPGRPMETWYWTWDQDWSKALSDITHWKKGVDAVGYRKILYGTGGQYYHISMPSYDETNPTTDETVYVGAAANFEGKPAQYYRSRKVYVEIVAD
ncbi:MAG: hypothetical protein PHF84_04415 [bacterium]|nr:hypothetical protein [bacterium]